MKDSDPIRPLVRTKLNRAISVIPLTVAMVLLLSFSSYVCQGQEFSLLIKNGHVIDPKNHIDGVMDVAVADGKVALVEPNIDGSRAKKVVDATGFYVTPGLINIHTHVFVGSKANTFADGVSSVSPDDFTFRSGVTTVVDAGTSGWRNFPQFKKQVIETSKTRILAFLNIFGSGMIGAPAEQDTDNMSEQMALATIEKYPDIIVGTCIGHYSGSSWTPFDAAERTAKAADRPLFVECHLPELSLQDQLNHMRPGDIMTHAYEDIKERMPVVDEQGKLRPFVLAAKQRGILFDVGHGGAGFWFSQAVPAFKQGLAPNSFGTDLHRFSMNAGMKNMLNVMSKYLTMGMSLNDIILRASWLSAESIKRPDLGNLSKGSVADITVLSIQNGKFGFVDAGGNKIVGDRKLQTEMTVRAGRIVWDLNGISAKLFTMQ